MMYRLIEADHYVNKRILIVGGGDSAVEAAMGLAHQIGNQVTLSYRKDAFSRIKERNAQRIEECMRNGKAEGHLQLHPRGVQAGLRHPRSRWLRRRKFPTISSGSSPAATRPTPS